MVGLGLWVPFQGVSPVQHLTQWYQPPNCSLKIFSRAEAIHCLANRSLLYNGASLTRSQFTSMTGFLLDDHCWDFVKHRVPPHCTRRPEGRYIHNKLCHPYLCGLKLHADLSCHLVKNHQRPHYIPSEVGCQRSSIDLGLRGCLGWATRVRVPITSRVFPLPDIVLFGFHFSMFEMDHRTFLRQLDQEVARIRQAVGNRRGTRFILHGMHVRDLRRVAAEYAARQSNGIQAMRNHWMEQYAARQQDMVYWHQQFMTDPRTGYISPPAADGTHTPLHVELMKAQLLLNHLCVPAAGPLS
eukprot:GGOE01040490.1.p1 GENE.GGOE01040490.1~~GGOE01040490.1.p1  ORF type:complete len:298 (+),score=50.90 GGOE01040490.1:343-1236(+)